nr:hypothetical protein [Tanacetum cinerariifolium]
MYGFKECSSCGTLYNKSCGCSKGGFVDKFIRDSNKTPDSSQRPPHDCVKCGNPVDSLHCRQCALLRKKLKDVWFKICDEHEFFQDFLNTSESSNDNTNIVNAPQEPFVFNHDPGENSSQSPPHIDHHCCYGCSDPLEGIFCRHCTCESFGNGAHIGYNCPSKVSIISNPKPCHNQNFLVIHQPPQETSVEILHDHENELAINTPSWNRHAFYNYDDDDEDYTIAITPDEPDNSLSMGDEHLDTIPATKSNEVIKYSSVEDLFPIPSEPEDIPDNTCDVPFRDNSSPLDIEPDQGELTSVVMEDILGEPRVHVPNVLPTHPTLMLDSDFIPSDNSLPESEIFYIDTEEKNSGSNTIHADISLLDFDHFHFEIEPDPGELTSIVDSGIRENVPSTTNVNLLPEDDQSPLFAYVVWIFFSFLTYPIIPPYLLSFENKDTIFDPGIFIYHSFMPSVSHRRGTFMKFNVYLNHLNESPVEILSSTCFPMDQ